QKKAEITQVQDSQAMIRARLLRENGKYLTAHSFAMRKNFFNNEETGYFKTQKRAPMAQNSSAMLTDMLKGNFINVLPMVVIGGWINWMFSGFVTTKVPFPLTLRFKPMLQRGVELASLDAAWVNNQADQTQAQADAMTGAAMTMPQDPKVAFKAEWEALEITEYQNALKSVDNDLLQMAAGDIQAAQENSVRQ
ncbi:hypothetical protein DOY81_014015, partial [Sarcophaga bullata]